NDYQIGEAQDARSEGGDVTSDEEPSAKLEREQRGSIVEQALAFENIDHTAGESKALCNRCGSDRIGGRDDRAQDQTNPPIKIGEKPLAGLGESNYRESYQTKTQHEDADKGVGKITPPG